MNALKISKIGYKYKVNGVEQERPHVQTEFIVDGVGLSRLFNFEHMRPWFGQTEFESSDHQIPALKGLSPPVNQFDDGRYVLYRCHCGADYCGVISCVITRTENSVKWTDFFYGDADGSFQQEDDEEDDGVLISNSEFEFEVHHYDSVINDFYKN